MCDNRYMKENSSFPIIQDYIADQSLYKELPYGSNGTVAGNGCGSIACYNALKYLGLERSYQEIYYYFNDDCRLLKHGAMGTNPFQVLKYLRKVKEITTKVYFSHLPKKKYDTYVILNLYHNKNRKGINGHYIFAHFNEGIFTTYNRNNNYEGMKDYFEKTKTYFYIIYGINKVGC